LHLKDKKWWHVFFWIGISRSTEMLQMLRSIFNIKWTREYTGISSSLRFYLVQLFEYKNEYKRNPLYISDYVFSLSALFLWFEIFLRFEKTSIKQKYRRSLIMLAIDYGYLLKLRLKRSRFVWYLLADSNDVDTGNRDVVSLDVWRNSTIAQRATSSAC